ncbi:MAG: hypothetical protein AABY15_04760 [Nanoarchaeota archaeon]
MKDNKSMAMKDGMCCGGICGACHGWMWTIAGAVILANALWPFLGWGMLIGILVLLKGLSKLAMPCCPHCK